MSTRNDIMKSIKLYWITALCVIPVLVLVNVLLKNKISFGWLIVLDTLLIIAGYCLAVIIADKHKARIARKRAEFVAKQKDNEQNK